MSDVRTLLRAKRQEIRIYHPLALYTSGGQLRCVVCEINIKHPSAWDGHLMSKGHRTNATRVKEEERRKELALEEPEVKRPKRIIPEDDIRGDTGNPAKKSKVVSTPPPSTSHFPSNFFSDPLRALPTSFNESDDEDEIGDSVTTSKLADTSSSLDQEWIQFQQSVVNAPDAADTYDHATIIAEPELVLNPSEGLLGHDATPVQPVAKTDEEDRRKKEQEERELIMDRLMDEERAQEEADMKVVVLKNKMEALRKRREAARSAKSTVGVV